jgi:hypothetical protein
LEENQMSDKQKLIDDEIRAELRPELEALSNDYFRRGQLAGPGAPLPFPNPGAGAGAAPPAAASTVDADTLGKRARIKQAAAAAIGLQLSNEQAVREVYQEAGIPID